MFTQTKFYYHIMCDSEDWFVKLSCEHVAFKFLYVQLSFPHIFCVDYADECTFTIHHDSCFSSFFRRLYFICQIQKHVILIIFIQAQRAKTHHRFFLFRFWEVTWPQNDSFSELIISVIWGVFFRLMPSCLKDEGCEVMINCILQNGFVEQFLWRCLFLPQSKHKSFVNQFFCLSDLAEAYCWMMSRFIESSAGMFDFAEAEFLVVRAVSWEFMNLNKQTELLYWRSSSIHWHMMTNSLSFLSSVVSISCSQILSEIFCHNMITLTDSFQSSLSIRSKNSEKKLVNSQFLCWRFSSFIIAVCLWLTSS